MGGARTVDMNAEGDIYSQAQQIVLDKVSPFLRRWRRVDVRSLDALIDELRRHSDDQPEHRLALLILQGPRAALAQRQMDKHPHGYHNKAQRVFELIDFNDAFVETVLLLPPDQLGVFVESLKLAIDGLCKLLRSPSFSSKQWEAITHGLSREVAVYLGAIAEGFQARMTSRQDDAMGVDMVVTDPQLRRSINLDVKTRSSFHFRLLDLVQEGRLSEEQRLRAELSGFCHIVNGHGANRVYTTLFRVDVTER